MGNYTQEYDWIVDEKDILTEFQRVTASGKYHLKCGGVDKNVKQHLIFGFYDFDNRFDIYFQIKNGSWVEVNHPVKYPNISAPFPLVEWVDSYICQTSAASLLNLSLTIVIVTTVFLLLV